MGFRSIVSIARDLGWWASKNAAAATGDSVLGFDGNDPVRILASGLGADAVAAHEAAGEHTKLDLPQIAEPATPSAGTVRLYATTSNGIAELELKDATGLVHAIGEEQLTRVRNTSGSTLVVGEAVYVSGSTGSTPNVGRARADAEATLPCAGLVVEAIDNNGFGRVMVSGVLKGVNTSAFSEGDVLWLSASVAGGLTTTRPTHPNFLQMIGTVTNSGVGNGSILVATGSVLRPLTQTITNGDTTHAPSADAVFDALALKVNKAGDTGLGTMTFNNGQTLIQASGGGKILTGGGGGTLTAQAGGASNSALIANNSAGTSAFIVDNAGAGVNLSPFKLLVDGSGNPAAPAGYAVTVQGSFGGGYRMIDGAVQTSIWTQNDGSMRFGTGDSAALTERMRIGATELFVQAPIRPGTYTVATLPASGLVAGMRATVTDATAPTYLGTLTGGGSVTCGVLYNGSAWVSG